VIKEFIIFTLDRKFEFVTKRYSTNSCDSWTSRAVNGILSLY